MKGAAFAWSCWALMLGVIFQPNATAADQLLLVEVNSPAWVDIALHGGGRVTLRASVTGAPNGSYVSVFSYRSDDTPFDAFLVGTPGPATTVRVVARVIDVDEGVNLPMTGSGVALSLTFNGNVDGYRWIVWSPTGGRLHVDVTRELGNVTAEERTRGPGGIFKRGPDLDGGVQATATTPFGLWGGIQAGAEHTFTTQGALLGWFGSGRLPSEGPQFSHVEGPDGSHECPCIFQEIRPGLAQPAGDYRFVRDLGVLGGGGIPSAAIVGLDVSPRPRSLVG